MKTPKIKRKNVIDQKVKDYFEGEQALLKKVGLNRRLVVLFPHRPYGAPSFFGKILLWLLRSAGGILDTEFSLKEK